MLFLFSLESGAQMTDWKQINPNIIVVFEDSVAREKVISEWNSSYSGREIHFIRNISKPLNADLLGFADTTADLKLWIHDLRSMKGVRSAQWDKALELRKSPDDVSYSAQWSHRNIGSEKVWDKSTGGLTANGDTIVVAILDAGFDVSHADLAGNIWINRSEIAGDGIDNDNNGFTDDITGWSFANNSPDHPSVSHGTAVAGIIGASGNNSIGISGINWNIKMMLFSVVTVSQLIEAYSYIVSQRDLYNQSGGKKGALVVVTNASLGISGEFCDDYEVWGSMYDLLGQVGILTAAAAGNSPVNIDIEGDMPCTCRSPFLITALATDSLDKKRGSSAYGSISVDMGAPGESVYTTAKDNLFVYFSGTSASAPQISGAIALLYSLPCSSFADNITRFPSQAALIVRNALLEGVTTVPSLKKLSLTGGKLDMVRSMEIISSDCNDSPGSDTRIISLFPNPAREGFQLEFTAPNVTPVSLKIINTLGQVVSEKYIYENNTWGKKLYYVHTDNLPPGIYILRLNNSAYTWFILS